MDNVYKIILQSLSDSGFEIEYLEGWNGGFQHLHPFALKQLRYELMFYMPLLALSEVIKDCYNPNAFTEKFAIQEAFKETELTSSLQDTLLLLFGECHEFGCAGYLLPNGKLLDFSEEGKGRQDHRYIKGIIEELVQGEFTSQTSGMIWMENHGAIRIHHNGLETATIPTMQQLDTIRRCRQYIEVLYVDVVSSNHPHGSPVSATVSFHEPLLNIMNFIRQTIEQTAQEDLTCEY